MLLLLCAMSTFLIGCGCGGSQTKEDLANEEKLHGTWCTQIDMTFDMASTVRQGIKMQFTEEQWRPEFDDLLNSYNADAIYRWYVDYNEDGTCRYYVNTDEYQEDMKDFTDQFAHIMAEIMYTIYEEEDGMDRATTDEQSLKENGLPLDEYMQTSFTETMKEYGASIEKHATYRIHGDSIVVTGDNGYYSDERFDFFDDDSMMLYLPDPYGNFYYKRVEKN